MHVACLKVEGQASKGPLLLVLVIPPLSGTLLSEWGRGRNDGLQFSPHSYLRTVVIYTRVR